MSYHTRLAVEFIEGEHLSITNELEEHIGEFLEQCPAFFDAGDAQTRKYFLDQLEEALDNLGDDQFMQDMTPSDVDDLFRFVARFHPKSTFAVLIFDETFRGIRIREYKNGTLVLRQGPFAETESPPLAPRLTPPSVPKQPTRKPWWKLGA